MDRLIECVPNFSEGRNPKVISAIVAAISSVENVKLLHVDSGEGANRTVVTFAGDPDAVVEAAFRGVKKAAELIDMCKHNGEHPRFGATDVLPLIPILGISMDETVEYARKLGQRIGEELGISVYSYGEAAFDPRRCELSYCRAGQYEGLPAKFATPDGKPDFGPDRLNVRSGASAVGARDFLIAYNVNLNTSSVEIAKAIAARVRESGQKMAQKQTLGSLKSVKAIGWYIEEFEAAQVSMNLTNIRQTPLHIAFDEVSRVAQEMGVKATGSEIVGLVPLQSLIDAGRYFLGKKGFHEDVSEHELVQVAINALGLNDKYEFKAEEKVLEYVMLQK
jgi:glutamate formiminotransferase / formiminotetrahydrofolate cyclodeaminase